jgi:hypothetical protein
MAARLAPPMWDLSWSMVAHALPHLQMYLRSTHRGQCGPSIMWSLPQLTHLAKEQPYDYT